MKVYTDDSVKKRPRYSSHFPIAQDVRFFVRIIIAFLITYSNEMMSKTLNGFFFCHSFQLYIFHGYVVFVFFNRQKVKKTLTYDRK